MTGPRGSREKTTLTRVSAAVREDLEQLGTMERIVMLAIPVAIVLVAVVLPAIR